MKRYFVHFDLVVKDKNGVETLDEFNETILAVGAISALYKAKAKIKGYGERVRIEGVDLHSA